VRSRFGAAAFALRLGTPCAAKAAALRSEKLLAGRAVARSHDFEPARLRAPRFGAAAFVLASLRAKAGGR